MPVKDLVMIPSLIFRQKTRPVDPVSQETAQLIEDLFDTMYTFGGIGIAAPMIGEAKSVMVVDLKESGEPPATVFINPTLAWCSQDMKEWVEASLSLPGVEATITRPQSIKIDYTDAQGQFQQIETKGFFATVIQHEMDYLLGKTFIDYLKPVKRQMMIDKSRKYRHKHAKEKASHICGPTCAH